MPRLVLVGVLCAAAHVAAAAAPESARLWEHSIAEPATKTVYVMTGTSKVQLAALDATTGKPRWTTSAAVKPLATRGHALAALDMAGKLVILDTRTGKPDKQCPAIATVVAPFVDGLGVNNAAWGYDDGATLFVGWSRFTFYSGGMAPTPEMEQAARSHSEGYFAIDLGACSAKAVPAPSAPSPTDVTTQSGKTATISKSLSLTPGNGGAAIDMTEGDATRRQLTVSTDHRFAIVADPTRPSTIAMFDLDSGAVTHPKLPAFPYCVYVAGSTLVTSAGGGLVAYDLATGKQKWQIAIHSTSYQGPYPP